MGAAQHLFLFSSSGTSIATAVLFGAAASAARTASAWDAVAGRTIAAGVGCRLSELA